MKNLTIEKLADFMNESVWVKGDLKRIYLNNAGHNTKKMATKCFIFQTSEEDFKVSVKIDCPSQAWQWIESQENQLRDRIERKIEKFERLSNLVLIEHFTCEEADNAGKIMCKISDSNSEPMWFNEDVFEERYDYCMRSLFNL
jgi:hypothetical protein